MNFADPMTYVTMAALSIPEQTVMYLYEPQMPLTSRLSVSAVMFAIHFAWNGFVPKGETLQDELPWILGTAAYARMVLGAQNQTAVALVAADSVMTLALR